MRVEFISPQIEQLQTKPFSQQFEELGSLWKRILFEARNHMVARKLGDRARADEYTKAQLERDIDRALITVDVDSILSKSKDQWEALLEVVDGPGEVVAAEKVIAQELAGKLENAIHM